VCLYQKSVCKVTVLVCIAVRLAFSNQTSAISFPFIPIPFYPPSGEQSLHHNNNLLDAKLAKNVSDIDNLAKLIDHTPYLSELSGYHYTSGL